MLRKHHFYMERLINSPSISKEIVEKLSIESLLGRQYGCFGLVQDVKIDQIGLFSTVDRKNIISRVPVSAELTIFSIPHGFIISNAILLHIKPVSNNITYVFDCNFYDVDGREIYSSTIPKTIIGTITTMDKSQESLGRYKFLKIGDRVNLVSIMSIVRDGTKNQVFNCDIIEHAMPKYFKYEKSIDTSAILSLATTDKVKYPLFEKHTGKLVTNLIEGNVYAMTIYGFTETDNREDVIDFLTESNTLIGIDSLNNYLYYVMYNWKCALEGLNNKENGGGRD